MASGASKRLSDPILTLQTPHAEIAQEGNENASSSNAVSSLCFLSIGESTASVDQVSIESESSDSEEDDLSFRCRGLVGVENSQFDGDMFASTLSGRFLASCHSTGAHIWDLGRRKVAQDLSRRGPGLVIRRLERNGYSGSRVLYHTRDIDGTISLHDASSLTTAESSLRGEGTVQQETGTIGIIRTYSRTFCCAAPCCRNPNLLALPSGDDTVGVVRDWRVPGDAAPVATIRTAASSSNSRTIERLGMVTSLAMSEIEENGGRPLVGLGMESGRILFYDLAMIRCDIPPPESIQVDHGTCGISLSNDPILSLDMVPSVLPCGSKAEGSIVAVAGMAGNREDCMRLEKADQGTVAVMKTTISLKTGMSARLRSRLTTCSGSSKDEPSGGLDPNGPAGKPGVSICRFRPDGRVFAVGGWDKRLRIFDRSKTAKPLAILKGHSASVNAFDWALDASASGLLATGSSDGHIQVWRCLLGKR